MVRIYKKTLFNSYLNLYERGVQWGTQERFEDFDLEDGICLLLHSYSAMENKLKILQVEEECVRLKINVAKTKELQINSNAVIKLTAWDHEIDQIESFLHFGIGGEDDNVKSGKDSPWSCFQLCLLHNKKLTVTRCPCSLIITEREKYQREE